MDLRTSPPFVVGSLRWQDAPEAWTMTIVVKLTLNLKAGTMTVAHEQEPIRERDLRRASDPEGRVNAPCDLVPFKSAAEVVVVGHGPSGGGSHLGRLAVGGVEKVIEIGAQTTLLGAELGPAETKWPLRADGRQPITMLFVPTPILEAPLGLEIERDVFHVAPPDQQLPELRGDESLVLEHLHPKLSYLSTRLPGIRPRARVEIDGMPPWEVDLSADTLWIDVDRSIGALVFRGLLPLAGRDQSGLVSIGVERPGEEVVFPEAPGGEDDPLFARPPTPPPPPPPRLNRRPSAPPASESPSAEEDESEQTQTNDNKLLETGPALAPAAGTALPFAARPEAPIQPWSRPEADDTRPLTPPPPPAKGDAEQTSVFAVPALRARTPTWLGGTEVPRPPAPPPPPPRPSTLRGMPDQTLPTSTALPVELIRRATPVPFQAPSTEPVLGAVYGAPGAPPPPRPSTAGILSPGQPPPPPRPSTAGSSAPLQPPPPVSQILRPAEPLSPPSLADASNRAAHDAPLVSVPAPPRGGGSTIGQSAIGQGTIGRRRVDGRSLANAALLGVAEASTAAALAADASAKEAARPTKPGIPVSPAAAPPPPRTLVDFLWYAPELPGRISEREDWRRLLEPEEKPAPPVEEAVADEDLPPDAPPRKKRKPPPPPPEKTPEERGRDERRRVTQVLLRAEPTSDVESALFTAIDADGLLTPPLVLVAGEVELPFDETETLRVLVGAAQSLASADKKLKETVDLAQDALGTLLVSSPDVAASFSARIRDAWHKSNRALSADYLELHARRILLEQRRYQMRELLGAQWIRGLFHGIGSPSGAPVPVYLPQELTKRLPLFVKFAARLVVEALPAQDQNETIPVALRALALARVIAASPSR